MNHTWQRHKEEHGLQVYVTTTRTLTCFISFPAVFLLGYRTAAAVGDKFSSDKPRAVSGPW